MLICYVEEYGVVQLAGISVGLRHFWLGRYLHNFAELLILGYILNLLGLLQFIFAY